MIAKCVVVRVTRLVVAWLVLAAITSTAVGQSLDWAKRAGGPNSDEGLAVAADAVGNSHVTGYLTGSATFAPGEPNQTTLVSVFSDVFVAKYAPDGTLSWVRQASGDNGSRGLGIAVDGSGNSYVTGVFRLFLSFVGGMTELTEVTGAGDMFLAKYSSAGSLQWAVQAGPNFIPGVPSGGKRGNAIATDASENSYVTGAFLTSLGEAAVFVAKYSAGGSLLWSRYALNSGVGDTASGTGIDVDALGNIYVTGPFAGTITFGPGEANQTALTSACSGVGGCRDLFVAKYDPSGALVWAKRAGPSAASTSLSLDSSGNPHIAGNFSGSAIFGLGESNQTTLLSSSPQNDVFLAKYAASGELIWARKAGGVGNDGAASIVVDGDTSHVTGGFEAAATFGAGEAGQTVLTAAGNKDIFIASFDSAGTLRWARQAGGESAESGAGISTDDSGVSYVTGAFAGTATFGPGEANQTTLNAPGTEIFVARLRNDSPVTNLFDLDIQRFAAQLRRSPQGGPFSVDLMLTVRNTSSVNEDVVATVVGVQRGVTIYNRSMTISDPPGRGASRFSFPSYSPVADLTADIVWTVTFQDQDPDTDRAVAITSLHQLVRAKPPRLTEYTSLVQSGPHASDPINSPHTSRRGPPLSDAAQARP